MNLLKYFFPVEIPTAKEAYHLVNAKRGEKILKEIQKEINRAIRNNCYQTSYKYDDALTSDMKKYIINILNKKGYILDSSWTYSLYISWNIDEGDY